MACFSSTNNSEEYIDSDYEDMSHGSGIVQDPNWYYNEEPTDVQGPTAQRTDCEFILADSALQMTVYYKVDRMTCSDGTSISRILRTVKNVKIPPKTGYAVPTNIFFVGNSDVTRAGRKIIYNIGKLADHWLAEESNQIVKIKEGILDNHYTGRIRIWVFNQSSHEITVTANSALGSLRTCRNQYPIS